MAEEETKKNHPQPLFPPVGDVVDDHEDTTSSSVVDSYCVGCGKTGTTRILLTRIPHFHEVILLAFECPHCGLRNNEIQSGQAIQERGVRCECRIETPRDLNRQLVRSESATLFVRELDFELPPSRGVLTTVEGILDGVLQNLTAEQPKRELLDPELFEKLNVFLGKLKDCLELKTAPFTIILDDPTGNSYIENLNAPDADPQISITHYKRTSEQNALLGLPEESDEQQPSLPSTLDEIMEFPTNCSHCNAPIVCIMQMINVPYFQDVLIMASNCDSCGARYNEVKSGGAIAPKGKRITLKIVDAEDLSRDILKSESAGLKIPEIDLELTPGTLGGRFSTVEGILRQVYDDLENRQPFVTGDSARGEGGSKFRSFLDKLQKVLSGEIKGTLILDDPLGGSYLQNLYAPDPDPNMEIEEYERTWEQNEMFGLNDIDTDPHHDDHPHADSESRS